MKCCSLAVLSCALATLTLVASGEARPTKREVFVPKVLRPRKGDVWRHGETRNVTWDISHVPKQISNGFQIYLRYNERISPFILAKGFDPRRGWVEVTVPWVDNGTYSLVLFGDSGNNSQ